MTDYSRFSDQELMEMIRGDNLAVFKDIYTRFWKKLYADAYKRLKNKELSEEVVQEIFTVFWVKRNQIVINTTISNYFFSSVSHKVIDLYRKEMVRSKYKEAFKAVASETDNSTEDMIFFKDLNLTLEAEISHLPDKCRSVYELSRNQHKTNKEIAQYLGISEKTVENHMTKALKKLRLNLADYLPLLLVILIK